MKTIADYVEKIKTKLRHKSYYETMTYLKMPRQSWTAIKKGAGVKEKNAIRMAQILEIDPLEIIAVSQALRAKNNESRHLWLRMAKEKEATNNQRHTGK